MRYIVGTDMSSSVKKVPGGGTGRARRGRFQVGTPVPIGNLVLPPGVSFNIRSSNADAGDQARLRERERSAREMQAVTQDLLATSFVMTGLRTGSTRAAIDATTTRPRAEARLEDGAVPADGASDVPEVAPPVASMADAVNGSAYRRLARLLGKRANIIVATERVRQIIEESVQGRMLMGEYIDASMAPTVRPRARGVTAEVLTLLSDTSNIKHAQRNIITYVIRKLRTHTSSYRR